ncbi:MAG: ISL3 family transposase [bacterium]
MRDRELYATILGLQAPWTVERVEVDLEGNAIQVWLAREEGAGVECPTCETARPIYDHRDREWRHLDTCQLETRLHARVPRVECPAHGVVQVRVPWATPGSQFTLLFERLVIDWLQEAAVAAVARRLGTSWEATWGIMQRAVRRGLERREALELEHVGVDEKSFQRRHDYVTVVSDLKTPRVLFVADDRKRESLEAFWALGLTDAQRAQIQAVAMDMWEPYVQATLAQVPDAATKIVFDKFHIAKHLNEGVDRVRRAEQRELKASGDERLTGTKYTWLRHPARFSVDAWRDFRELRDSQLKVARAWALKETVTALWDYRYVGAARRFFRRWYFWATHSRLQPMIEKARLLKTHLDNVLTYLRHRITNATAEGLNAKIQWIKYTARGFRNRENFKIAIYFHCGALDLYPH